MVASNGFLGGLRPRAASMTYLVASLGFFSCRREFQVNSVTQCVLRRRPFRATVPTTIRSPDTSVRSFESLKRRFLQPSNPVHFPAWSHRSRTGDRVRDDPEQR